MLMAFQLYAKANTDKKKNSFEISPAAPLTLIWSEFQRDFFLCLQNNFWFTFWPLNKVQLLDPLNSSLLPPYAEGEPVCPRRLGFIGGDGIHTQLHIQNAKQPLLKYPFRSF